MATRGKRYVLGKVDYHGRGRKVNKVELTWSVEEGRFAMSGGVWNGNGTDYTACGQMVDDVAQMFPHNAKVQRMAAIWRRWHLNDLKAGSAVQEAYLREWPIYRSEYAYPRSYFEVASQVLTAAGLNPDPDGYVYGTAWKREALPADVLAEIEGW